MSTTSHREELDVGKWSSVSPQLSVGIPLVAMHH